MQNQNEMSIYTHTRVVLTPEDEMGEAGVKRLRTIVADDSSTFLEVICALLELDGQVDVVARARDGIDAIEAVAKLRPDLVLMDIEMPSLDGLDAALIISSRLPSTRIVLMSADESPEIRADAQACGAKGFIHKPRFREEFRQAFGFQ